MFLSSPIIGFGKPRQLGTGQDGMAVVLCRDDQRDEGDDANAAHPCGGDAPKLQTFGQRFNVVENGGPCGGEARDALKEGIDYSELTAEHQKRHGPKDTCRYPAACNDAIAVFNAHFLLGMGADDSKKPSQCRCHRGKQQGIEAAVTVVSEGDEGGQIHQ